MIDEEDHPQFWVVTFTTRFDSLDDVQRHAPTELAAHVARSRDLHRQGRLLMAGAFDAEPGRPVTTMGILRSRADAEDFADHDPFWLAGMLTDRQIRAWSNLFYIRTPSPPRLP